MDVNIQLHVCIRRATHTHVITRNVKTLWCRKVVFVV